jgi:uncharacterized protein
MAEAPRPGRVLPRLQPLLGPDGCARLQRVLVARTLRWASATGRVFVAHALADAHDEMAALAPRGASVFAQSGGALGERLESALARVADDHPGPLVVVGTAHPALSAAHVDTVLADFADGVDVCLGPANDGTWYLLAARRPHPALFAIDPSAWGGPEVFGLTLRSLLGAGLEVGWLRNERALSGPADVAALLADPCAPEDVRAALRSGP